MLPACSAASISTLNFSGLFGGIRSPLPDCPYAWYAGIVSSTTEPILFFLDLVPAFDNLADSESEWEGFSTYNGFKGGEVEVGIELFSV